MSDDEAEILAIQSQQADAWNSRDIHRFASLFTVDANVVNKLGWQWKSRAEMENKLGAAFATVHSASRLTIEKVTVDFLRPDVAVAHVHWTMTGEMDAAGSASGRPEAGIQIQVVVKQGEVWRSAHFQNTELIPEPPFPSAEQQGGTRG
jgi:uncharacterized protein (TIGR02246 family)